ncbi:MAG: CPBP family intramembrane metalloprotease [Myxococcales bacterium]|nr:CPBP family intramembrane metalloprotease [Myxococcales bacterium]
MSREMKQALMAFGVSTALVALLGLVARGVGFVNANLGALVAIVFLYLTVYVANRRGEDLVDFGFLSTPRLRSVVIALTYIAVVFPIFMAGFVVFYDLACAKGSAIAQLAPPGLCFGYEGWGGAHWPSIGLATLELAFVQIVVVALPEELFFRGLIHELCERAVPPKRRVLGGGIGWALIISSALFALGHLTVTFDARRLSVFFPGLVFGWMRSATGSILAGTIAHAASNLFIHILQKVFLENQLFLRTL